LAGGEKGKGAAFHHRGATKEKLLFSHEGGEKKKKGKEVGK